jgi:hypothetical protein
MEVVVVEEEGKTSGALVGVGAGVSAGPFAQGGLDKALGFAVGFWSVEASEAMLEGKAGDRFADMPRDYEALCRLHLPRPIHDQADYENTVEIADAFAGFEKKMTPGQEDYFHLLCTLIEAWETK